jgi:hypothetical protein
LGEFTAARRNDEGPATFAAALGIRAMKTFLKVLIVLLVALLALKLLPVLLGLGIALIAVLALAAVLGLGAAGVLLGLALGLVALLSPIWLPVLAIVGLVALWEKLERAA